MPGLSPDPGRFDRIIALCNDGGVTLPDYERAVEKETCWRCQRSGIVVNRLTLCDECRAYLSCETDDDPVPQKEPAPTGGYYGWAYAAYQARQQGVDIRVTEA